MRSIAGNALTLILVATAAAAADPDFLGQFDAWNAFKGNDNGLYCYMASLPDKQEGGDAQRGDTFAVVTHRPGEKSFDVVSIRAGYSYQPNSEVTISIGGDSFKMFTRESFAWSPDADTDRAIVAAMKAGRDMEVKGTSSRGATTTDTYSLKGFTAAHATIDKACGNK